MSNSQEEPLDVELSGSAGQPEGIVALLEQTATFMREIDEGRYDIEIHIQEVRRDD
jgi:hypothetical protein